MPLEIKFGGMTLDELANRVEQAVITDSDMLYCLNRQKARMLDRTSRGVDVDGLSFTSYSTRGPYYYYPNRHAGRGPSQGHLFGKKTASAKTQRGAAARSFAKKVGGKRTALGVKFASYADFKSSLGRTGVDLMGPSAPHMLQGMVVKVTGQSEGLIGIYGKESDRATGHNDGTGRVPKRRFFDWGNDDGAEMTKDLDEKQGGHLKKIFG